MISYESIFKYPYIRKTLSKKILLVSGLWNKLDNKLLVLEKMLFWWIQWYHVTFMSALIEKMGWWRDDEKLLQLLQWNLKVLPIHGCTMGCSNIEEYSWIDDWFDIRGSTIVITTQYPYTDQFWSVCFGGEKLIFWYMHRTVCN